MYRCIGVSVSRQSVCHQAFSKFQQVGKPASQRVLITHDADSRHVLYPGGECQVYNMARATFASSWAIGHKPTTHNSFSLGHPEYPQHTAVVATRAQRNEKKKERTACVMIPICDCDKWKRVVSAVIIVSICLYLRSTGGAPRPGTLISVGQSVFGLDSAEYNQRNDIAQASCQPSLVLFGFCRVMEVK